MKLYAHIFVMLLLGVTSAIAMDTTADIGDKVTFACDWCQEQKEALNKFGPEKACKGIDCTHILCDTCNIALSDRYKSTPEDQRFFYCHRCRAFYTEKNKVCWYDDLPGWAESGVEFTDVGAGHFHKQYGGASNRQLPDVTGATQLPVNQNGTTTAHKPSSKDKNSGMSPAEKADFKRQLKAAGTSQEMEQVVKAKLKKGYNVQLFINSASPTAVTFNTQDVIETQDTQNFKDICNTIEEVFFEELSPLFGEHTNASIANTTFEKYKWAYQWTGGSVETTLGEMYKIKQDIDNHVYVFRHDQVVLVSYIKRRIDEINGGGTRSVSDRVTWFLAENNGSIVGPLASILLVGIIGGIVYYYWPSKVDEQDEDTEADQETINNDDAQDALKGTIR